jgi:hypothetical protein
MIFSVAALGSFIWVLGFLLPRALRQRDPLALTCVGLSAALALFLWLFVGVRIQSP